MEKTLPPGLFDKYREGMLLRRVVELENDLEKERRKKWGYWGFFEKEKKKKSKLIKAAGTLDNTTNSGKEIQYSIVI